MVHHSKNARLSWRETKTSYPKTRRHKRNSSRWHFTSLSKLFSTPAPRFTSPGGILDDDGRKRMSLQIEYARSRSSLYFHKKYTFPPCLFELFRILKEKKKKSKFTSAVNDCLRYHPATHLADKFLTSRSIKVYKTHDTIKRRESGRRNKVSKIRDDVSRTKGESGSKGAFASRSHVPFPHPALRSVTLAFTSP